MIDRTSQASALAARGDAGYLRIMRQVFDTSDRARLRERFFGATHTVLARL